MNCFAYSSENQEKEDKPKEEEAKEPVVEEKPKPKSSQPKEAAPAFMSSVFALLDVYMTKMLVSAPHHMLIPFSIVQLSSHPLFCHLFWKRGYAIRRQSAGDFAVNQTFSLQNYLARNFYNMRFLALFVCFAINFILLFYKVNLKKKKA